VAKFSILPVLVRENSKILSGGRENTKILNILCDLMFSVQIPALVRSWCVWEILDKYPALVRYYSEGAAGAAAFAPHYYFLRT
jgi:hypothetical protein